MNTIFRHSCVAMLKARGIATFFGVGFFKPAPGTMGSLASLVIWGPCVLYEVSPIIRFSLVLAVFLIGWWATHKALPSFPSQDPKEVVIDEVAGQGMALVWCPGSFVALSIGFVLFRLFDIVKPWPISWIDRKIKNAFGVMFDDLLAGLFAAGTLWLAY